jgi:hypothetical protein
VGDEGREKTTARAKEEADFYGMTNKRGRL